jgi:hypothetical protein
MWNNCWSQFHFRKFKWYFGIFLNSSSSRHIIEIRKFLAHIKLHNAVLLIELIVLQFELWCNLSCGAIWVVLQFELCCNLSCVAISVVLQFQLCCNLSWVVKCESSIVHHTGCWTCQHC